MSNYQTTVSEQDGFIVVILYKTPVVKFDDQEIILNSGGWQTATTKTRMNQASNQFDLGFRVFQRKGEWYVDTKSENLQFEDGMVIAR